MPREDPAEEQHSTQIEREPRPEQPDEQTGREGRLRLGADCAFKAVTYVYSSTALVEDHPGAPFNGNYTVVIVGTGIPGTGERADTADARRDEQASAFQAYGMNPSRSADVAIIIPNLGRDNPTNCEWRLGPGGLVSDM